VTVVETSNRLIPREDSDVSAAVLEILEGEGIQFELGTECVKFEKRDSTIRITTSRDGAPNTISGSHLLLAVGRKPNTDSLGLDQAGIAVNERGLIDVDEQLRTSADQVWALGEVNGRGSFTHTAYNDFEIVAANLFSQQPRSVADRTDCYALFVDPPLGRVGLTEASARAAGYSVGVGKLKMSQVGRAREFGETQGFMKVVVDADTDKILGAAILGLSGDEAIHCIIDAMNADLPYTSLRQSMHIHPTVAELIPSVFGDIDFR